MNNQVITFVRTTKSTDQFSQNEYTDYVMNQMVCYSYNEWKNMIIETNSFNDNELLRKYFDFDKLLMDKWEFSNENEKEHYYLVEEDIDGKFTLLGEKEFDFPLDNVWIVTIPNH